jgi:hypothetical protein
MSSTFDSSFGLSSTICSILTLSVVSAGCGVENKTESLEEDGLRQESGIAEGSDGSDGSDGSAETDADGDGLVVGEDCDDADPAVGSPTDLYIDRDGDGYGDPASLEIQCPSALTVAVGDDCDDLDAAVHPEAPETDCTDPIDYNCDGSTGYADADGDGFAACTDCNDAEAAAHAGALEICDGVDNDCNGTVDGADALGASQFFEDGDIDGYGDPTSARVECEMPEGYVTNNDDCDDGTDAVNPSIPEVCNGVDDDCDGATDDADASLSGASTYYIDYDGDGYGSDRYTELACAASPGWVDNLDDCDDTSALSAPGAVEICDGDDNDCDLSIDEGAVDATTWYPDTDLDGHGASAGGTQSCSAPAAAWSASHDDCDDTNAGAAPGLSERCDGSDNDCDGTADEADAVDAQDWYTDADGDSFGASTGSVRACTNPGGRVTVAGDCNDGANSTFPGATEVCDGADNDCDSTTDEPGASGEQIWYLDDDGDGSGDPDVWIEACTAPADYVSNDEDCDDSNPAVTDCRCSLSAVSSPTLLLSSGSTYGAWMKDAAGGSTVWEFDTYYGASAIRFADEAAMISRSGTSFTLPRDREGTGHAIYNGLLYYPQYGTNTLVQYDLSTGTIRNTLSLSSAGHTNTYHYTWGGYSDIDFAVDEQGLWVIYATAANSGRIVVSKLDPDTFTITDTYNTGSSPKTGLGNAFMICGVLYTTASYSAATTTINYRYDTETSTGSSISIPFTNPGGYNSYISYNPADQRLYSWDDRRRQVYTTTIID